MEEELINNLNKYYDDLFAKHGKSPEGLGWNGKKSQYVRFRQLVKLFNDYPPATIADFGCGFAEFLKFLKFEDVPFSKYIGIDINENSLKEAQEEYSDAEFMNSANEKALPQADYYISSGVFNIHTGLDSEVWIKYIKQQLDRINEASTKGFAFNILTTYSDPEKMEAYLFYADPMYWFDWCKKHYSRNVALLHDYELYEFTLLVRK